jgi:hypothetical protein
MAAPNPRELRVALKELNTAVAHLAGTVELPWIRRRYRIPLLPDVYEYDLTLPYPEGADCPCGAVIDKWEWAYLILGTGKRKPLELQYERSFLNREDDVPVAGEPCAVWIKRELVPWAVLDRKPIGLPTEDGEDPITGLTLEIAGQHEAGDLTESDGRVELILPSAWQLYLTYAAAVEIGNGPIRRLPDGTLRDFKVDRDRYKAELLAGSRPEHKTPRITRAWMP